MTISLGEGSFVICLMFADNKRVKVDVLAVLYRPAKEKPLKVTYRFRHRADGGKKNWYEFPDIPNVEEGKRRIRALVWALSMSARRGNQVLEVTEMEIDSGDHKVIVAKMKESGWFDAEETMIH